MERQKDKVKEVSKDLKEKTDKELERLRDELIRLRRLKKQKQANQQQETQEQVEQEEEIDTSGVEDIEERFQEIDQLVTKEMERGDLKTYEEHASYIESELRELEKEIVGEEGLIEEELSTYEKLLENYPWLQEPRYEYMYQIPNKEKNPNDFESWQNEWAKVLFDYAKYAILHILYLRQLYTEAPFSNFENRKKAIREIAERLVNQELAEWLSKKKEKLRVYWKTLDLWAEEIYDWAYEMGRLEPILIYEIRDAAKEFSSLPKEDFEKIFEMLSEEGKGKIIKLENGKIAFKIDLE
ncbi:MAG: hypothetical protein BAJALOKI3v1_750022 [Promethearchaeota archaeon]|jgi:hypothetical protein|nr:MAG: hypothetical protein BAJALOKI3v1_750022 [Candidatus Lokiarchaeota archaeon]